MVNEVWPAAAICCLIAVDRKALSFLIVRLPRLWSPNQM